MTVPYHWQGFIKQAQSWANESAFIERTYLYVRMECINCSILQIRRLLILLAATSLIWVRDCILDNIASRGRFYLHGLT